MKQALYLAAALALPHGVMVVDLGIDFTHSQLKEHVAWNQAELSGQSGIDDDSNGFVDDIAGWNLVSNNGIQMPPKVLTKFLANSQDAARLMNLYGRYCAGEAQARLYFQQHHDEFARAWTYGYYAHATNVGGVVVQNSESTALLRNINIFHGSGEDPDANVSTNPPVATAGSAYDSPVDADRLIHEASTQYMQQAETISNYLKATGFGVANLSFSMSWPALEEYYDSLWRTELKNQGRDPATKRSPSQESNYQRVVTGVEQAYVDSWTELLGQNPNVFFVFSAGNNHFNLEDHEVYPAKMSLKFQNTITVVASDNYGDLTRFSNYGAHAANLGAPGVAVAGPAPGNLQISLTGTSQAAPAVAGVAAHLRQVNPLLSAADIRRILEATAEPRDYMKDKISSGGNLNAKGAIEAARKTALGYSLSSALANTLAMNPYSTTQKATNPLELELGDTWGWRAMESLSLPKYR